MEGQLDACALSGRYVILYQMKLELELRARFTPS